jgi:hypothetical protein
LALAAGGETATKQLGWAGRVSAQPAYARWWMRSAIMIGVRFVTVEGTSGMIEASTARRPPRPLTSPSPLTTAQGSPGRPLARWRSGALQGTHTGPLATPFGTIPATGNRMDAPCADIFELQGGKIKRFDCYPEGSVILTQLGVIRNLEAALEHS